MVRSLLAILLFQALLFTAAACTTAGVTSPEQLAASNPPAANTPAQQPDGGSQTSTVSALVEEGSTGLQTQVANSGTASPVTGTQTPTVNGLSGELAALPSQEPPSVSQIDSANGLSFTAVEGIPPAKLRQLSNSLSTAASASGLTVLAAPATGARYRVTGYVSAFADGTGTRLVYVWDVNDASGKRLHRINGQTRTNRIGADPWSAIGEDELAQIARETTARIKRFVQSRG